ncbi:MAG: hypothetical protein H6Q17_2036 [Bacteroidetes bacterium]|nr:hypothetical protein [Bacteroidota bacterium]
MGYAFTYYYDFSLSKNIYFIEVNEMKEIKKNDKNSCKAAHNQKRANKFKKHHTTNYEKSAYRLSASAFFISEHQNCTEVTQPKHTTTSTLFLIAQHRPTIKEYGKTDQRAQLRQHIGYSAPFEVD